MKMKPYEARLTLGEKNIKTSSNAMVYVGRGSFYWPRCNRVHNLVQIDSYMLKG